MHLGYITKENPLDRKAYSGTHFSMYQSLLSHFEHVLKVGPVDSWAKYLAKLKGKLLSLQSDKTYKYQYHQGLAKRMAEIIDLKISNSHQPPDALLASLMTPEVAHLDTSTPLFITSDATFPLLNDQY